MQFQVPQFIEVEDKIFGPLTFKQFVYVSGGLGAAYIIYRLLPSYFAFPLMLAIAGFGAALAFLKYNGRPFIVVVESVFYYFLRARLYLWNNERKAKPSPKEKAEKEGVRPPEIYVPRISESKLRELAWSLDINERIAAGVNTPDERGQKDIVSPIRTAREARI